MSEYDVTHIDTWHKIRAHLVWSRVLVVKWDDPMGRLHDELKAWFIKNKPILTVRNSNSMLYYHIYFKEERDLLFFKLKFGNLEYNEPG